MTDRTAEEKLAKMIAYARHLEARLGIAQGGEKITLKEVAEEWGAEVCAKANEVDPLDEHEWRSMWIGFAIGRGLAPEVATDYDFYMEFAFPFEGMARQVRDL